MLAIRLSSVVLPEPFGPNTPTISPRAMPNDTSDTAVRPPKRLVSVSTSSSMAFANQHRPPQQARHGAVNALRHHQDGEDQDRSVDDRAHLRPEVDDMRQRRQQQGSDHRSSH